MYSKIIVIGLPGFLTAGLAFAEGVSINPGQWEMTMTMEMSMMPQPQVHSSTECMKESEISPEDFNMDQNTPCDITDVAIDGNTARWSISCPAQGGMVMEGQWEFTSSGDSIVGNGSMSAETAGMNMDFKMDWEGKRIGDC